jgi:2-polyprenyl-3-methyl-5-hydroxy-6-metoxy-1,4-benzoquinol methylase
MKKEIEKNDLDKNIFSLMYSKYTSNQAINSSAKIKLGSKTEKIFDARYSSFLPADLNAKIIDVGSGSGRMLEWLEKKGFKNIEGIDASEEQVSLAKKSTIAHVIKENINEWGFGVQKYELILLLDVLEHLSKPDAITLLQKLKEALKINDKIIIQVPNYISPFGLKIQYGDITHVTAYNEHSLSQLLRISGFGQVKILQWLIPTIDIKTLIRRALVSTILKILAVIYFIETPRREIFTANVIAVAQKIE